MEQLYCDVPECDDPENPGFARQVFRYGKCSSHVKQLQRRGETTSIKERLPLMERLIEVYDAYSKADDDDDYKRHRRQFLALAKSLGKEQVGEAIREAIARARSAGKRIGRPPKAESVRVCEVFDIVGSVTLTARLLGLHRSTVYDHLARVGKDRVSRQPPVSAPRPRLPE